MTEYTRTPIEVADMQWGDLIAEKSWAPDVYELFVGMDPYYPLRFASVGYDGDEDDWIVSGSLISAKWFKLTPKPDPILCVNCGKQVYETTLGAWLHLHDRFVFCNLRATPPA